jgi:ATP-binding cassette subfamily B multidrug efflux pump
MAGRVSPLAFARRYLFRYARWYLGGVAALIATNWLAVSIPLQVAHAVDALSRPGAASEVRYRAMIIAAMGVGVILVRTASRLLFFTPGRRIEAQAKHELFASLIRQQPAFFRKYPPGDLVSRATGDINNVRVFAGFGSLALVNVIAGTLMAGAQMARISPKLAVLTLIPIGAAFALTQLSVSRLFLYIQQMQRELAALSDAILSTYQGIATVQAFGAEQAFSERFEVDNQRYLQTNLKRSSLRVVLGPALGLAISINIFFLLYFGGPIAIAGGLSVGDLVAFITLVGLLVNPLRGISFLLSMWKQCEVSMIRLGEVMDPPPDRPDLPSPRPAPVAPPALEVRGLTFSFPDEPDRRVLDAVSFRVPAGGTLGVFGPTGAGKTTLLRCLSRLNNPPAGTVFVDGQDLVLTDLDAWRERAALVPQRAFLFSDTLADNIRLGDPAGAGGDVGEVLALTTLDIDARALPSGVDSVVGESGIMLSGGQRQRAALARGLFRPRSMLMLDDVLSAVDHETESRLVAAIRGQMPRPTTVIVANRISALMHADVIVVLEGGRVTATGDHDELSKVHGIYRDTWERQQGEAAS